MKKILRKTWFQVVLFGILIGAVLIIVDRRFDLLNRRVSTKGEYKGLVNAKKDEMYFTTAEYPEIKYDFGKAKEGDTIKHVFKLKNTGDQPLFIFKGAGTCECIHPVFNSDPVPPGGEKDITVYFDTHGRKGKQTRTVLIDTNTDPAEMVLTLTGEVE